MLMEYENLKRNQMSRKLEEEEFVVKSMKQQEEEKLTKEEQLKEAMT